MQARVNAIGVENDRLRLGLPDQRERAGIAGMGLWDTDRRRWPRHPLGDFRRHQNVARVALKSCLDAGKRFRPALVLASAGAALIGGLLELARIGQAAV